MKKKYPQNGIGETVLLYPGLSVRAGSVILMNRPSTSSRKQVVDNFVDNRSFLTTPAKDKRNRGVCLKNKHN